MILKNKPMMALAAANTGKMLANGGRIADGTIRIIDGIRCAYNAASKMWRVTKKQGNGAAVSHPGALPGAAAAPIAISRQIRGSKPKFRSTKGVVTITHREFLSTVQAVNTGFLRLNNGVSPGYYRINPSNSAVTPWLVNIAANFDMYRFRSVSLRYIPMCATTEVGRVGLFWDKDSQDVGPFDRAELANYAHVAESSVWAETVLNIPCDGQKRFCNDSAVADPKLTELGRIGFVTYGTNTSNFIGDVFIEYTVELHEPQPSSNLVAELLGTGGTFSAARGSNVIEWRSDTSSASVVSIMFKPGTYLVQCVFDGTTVTGASVTAVGGGAVLNSKVVFTTTEGSISATVDMSEPNNRLDFGVTAAVLSGWNVFATRITRELALTINS